MRGRTSRPASKSMFGDQIQDEDLLFNDPDLRNHRCLLQDKYLELTRIILPEQARKLSWHISEDHCFMRIILDQIFNGCWYHHLDKRLVAYKQLSQDQLKVGIALAESILQHGESLLDIWNRQSLSWRLK